MFIPGPPIPPRAEGGGRGAGGRPVPVTEGPQKLFYFLQTQPAMLYKIYGSLFAPL